MSTAVPQTAVASRWGRLQDLILPVGMIASVLVILMPMPADIMDILLSANVAVAVIMLLTTLYVRTPLEFSVFPSLLLATTLFRLVLNVATTRLILNRADDVGELAAGHVVQTFGKFVTGGAGGTESVVVGLVIFSIVVLIQFVVITKGATRISEVAARFTLDGMPGKQMAIDADLNAGLIDQREAQRRRQEISSQADFFGAMDGASKFVRGDAVAGIVMILINIIGGLAIGIFEHGMSLSQAASLFTTLTIGDGLVTQVPAFLISLSAGMLVTRSSQASNLPRDFVGQLFSRPAALALTAAFLGLLIFTSLPTIPLMMLAGGCAIVSIRSFRRETNAKSDEEKRQSEAAQHKNQRVEDFLAVDPMELELGVGLLRLADRQRGGDLLNRVQRVRNQLAAELGIVLPKVRIRDNMRLEPKQYRILLAGSAVSTGSLDGVAAPDAANRVENHLAETVRRHADELLTRDATKHLLDELRQTSPAAVDEVVPNLLKVGEVQRVLQLLLREQVSIRPLEAILETLGDYASQTKNPIWLAEYARRRLARSISSRYRDADGQLQVITLDPALEEHIIAGMKTEADGLALQIAPDEVEEMCRAVEIELQSIPSGKPRVALVSSSVRPAFRQITQSRLPQLVVLGYGEIVSDTKVESVGMAAVKTPSASAVPSPHFLRIDGARKTVPLANSIVS